MEDIFEHFNISRTFLELSAPQILWNVLQVCVMLVASWNKFQGLNLQKSTKLLTAYVLSQNKG